MSPAAFSLIFSCLHEIILSSNYLTFSLLSNVFAAFSKICCRCGAEYKINVNGSCVRKEECNFHWGRLRRHKGTFVCLFKSMSSINISSMSGHLGLFLQTANCNSFPFSPNLLSSCLCHSTVAGGWETSYSCCAAAVGTLGCQVAKV